MIQIDDNPWEIGKNFPADCGMQGDIKTSLAELNAALEAGFASGEAEWRKFRERAQARAAETGRREGQGPGGPGSHVGGRARRPADLGVAPYDRVGAGGHAGHSHRRRLLDLLRDPPTCATA